MHGITQKGVTENLNYRIIKVKSLSFKGETRINFHAPRQSNPF